MPETEGTTPEFATAAQFRTALAKALLKVAREQSLRRTDAQSLASRLGLPRPVSSVAGGDDYVFPGIPEPETFDGHPREHFKPEVLAGLEAGQLWDARYTSWMNMRNEEGFGLTTAQIEQVCRETGLPLPSVRTSVSVVVKGFGTASFTVDGEVTPEHKEEIRAHFAQHVMDPVSDAVRALFPDAEGLPMGVSISTRVQKSWPDFGDRPQA